MKQCNRCKEHKPLEDFYSSNNRKKTYYFKNCKICHNEVRISKKIYKVEKGYVYIASESLKDSLTKIGFTKNPEQRLKFLKTSSGRLLDNFKYWDSDTDLEKRLHCLFEDKRKIGEWFCVDFEEINKIVKELV